MARFIQQQIPLTPTRSIPTTPCPVCDVAVASPSGAPSAFVSEDGSKKKKLKRGEIKKNKK